VKYLNTGDDYRILNPMKRVMALGAITTFTVFSVGNRKILRKASRTTIEEEDVEMISTL